MQYMVKALTRSKRTVNYVFIEANTEQQAIDYAIFSRQFLIRDSEYLILLNIHQ